MGTRIFRCCDTWVSPSLRLTFEGSVAQSGCTPPFAPVHRVSARSGGAVGADTGLEPLTDVPACLGWRGGEEAGGVEHLTIGPIGHLARPRSVGGSDQVDRPKRVVVQITDHPVGDADVRVRRGDLR